MKGVVYRLTCLETGDVYYGSTIAMRRRKAMGWSANLPETFIVGEPEIIEKWEGDDIRELRKREDHYIEQGGCVNRLRAYRTEEQIREQRLAEYHRNKVGRRANEKRKEKRFTCEFCKSEIRWDYRHVHWNTVARCIDIRKNLQNIKKGTQSILPFTKGKYKNISSSEWIPTLPNIVNKGVGIVV